MEVTILDALNAPLRPVLTIHTGSVRRQAKLEVNQPFIIPHPGAVNSTVEVSLFQQLASQLLPDDGKPEAVANIPVRKPDGTASQVKLGVKRGKALPTLDPPKLSNQDPLSATRDYLDHHQLQQKIQNLIQDVLHNQPDDPYRYMLQQLKQGQASPEDAVDASAKEPAGATEESSLVPRPPQEPKPASGSPRKGRGSKGGADEAAGGSSEAQLAAMWTIRQVLQLPACIGAAEDSLRERVWRDQSVGMAASIMVKARDTAATADLNKAQEPPAAVDKASLYLTPEYHHALVHWTMSVCLRGAANIIGEDEARRKECFADEDSRRRISLPTPIVYLTAERSWGQWLSRDAGGPRRASSG
jgi:hypothetical protein